MKLNNETKELNKSKNVKITTWQFQKPTDDKINRFHIRLQRISLKKRLELNSPKS